MGRLTPGLGRLGGWSWPIARAHVGLHLVWEMLGRCARAMAGGLEYVFLTVLTRGRLFVPDTNPLRGPRRSFVDGGCSGNLPLGSCIGDEEVSAGRGGEEKAPGHVQQGRFSLDDARFLTAPFFLCYILYIEQWRCHCNHDSSHCGRCPRSSMPWADTCAVQVSTT